MPKLHIANLNQTIEVKPGTTILDAAIEYDLALDHVCGGCCACTTCRVVVKEGMANLSKQEEDELDLVETIRDIKGELRLGCQTKIMGDVTIEIPQ